MTLVERAGLRAALDLVGERRERVPRRPIGALGTASRELKLDAAIAAGGEAPGPVPTSLA